MFKKTFIAVQALIILAVILFILMYTSFKMNEKIVTIEKIVQVPVEKIIYKTEYINVNVFIKGKDVNKLIKFYQEMYPEEYEKILTFYDQYTKSRRITTTILKYSFEYDVSYHTSLSLAKRESGFNSKSENINKNGSVDRGLYSLNNIGREKWKRADFFNIDKNTKEALTQLHWLLEDSEDHDISLSAYNAGYPRIKRKDMPYTTAIHVFTIKDYEYMFDVDFNTKLLPTLKHIEYQDGKITLKTE